MEKEADKKSVLERIGTKSRDFIVKECLKAPFYIQPEGLANRMLSFLLKYQWDKKNFFVYYTGYPDHIYEDFIKEFKPKNRIKHDLALAS